MPADHARGRIYVPAEDLRHFGVTEDDIAQRRATPQVGALVRYEVARTRALFERARPLIDVVGADLAVELALMWHGGMRILDKIGAAGPRLLQQPAPPRPGRQGPRRDPRAGLARPHARPPRDRPRPPQRSASTRPPAGPGRTRPRYASSSQWVAACSIFLPHAAGNALST